MKVICAGTFKTGTTSMHVALEQLGFSVHDYMEALEIYREEYCRFSEKGWSIGEFGRMYEKVDAVLDTPAFYFWEEVLAAFPEAKVVLTVRDDEETWHRSISNQIDLVNGPHVWFFYLFGSDGWKNFMRFYRKTNMLAFGGLPVKSFDPYLRFTNPLVAKQMYRRHIAHVKSTCPKDRLLVFNCKEGWEPLCAFLGKAVPTVPFPFANVNGVSANLGWMTDYFAEVNRATQVKCAITCTGLFAAAWFLKRKLFT